MNYAYIETTNQSSQTSAILVPGNQPYENLS